MTINETTKQNRPKGSVTFDNQGRVVLITGGASGIGLAVCQAFSASGAQVICLDRKEPVHGELPAGTQFIRCDVSVDSECESAIQRLLDRHHALDVLVNNAAIQPKASYHPIHELTEDVWQQMVGTNLSGYHHMARHALPIMLKQRSGVIVNMASGQAHRTARQVGVYGPIKAANIMQTRQWGIEYARHGIRVVSVSPGAIDTPLVRASLKEQGGGEALANRHPIGRIGRSEEVASAVLWLASTEASFVTATDLEVDGGLGSFAAFADPYPDDRSQSSRG